MSKRAKGAGMLTRSKGRRTSVAGWIGAVLVVVVMAGCGKDKKPPPPQPVQVPTASAKPDPSVAALEEKEASAPTYIYTPVGKRDPFKSFYKVEKKERKEGPGGILTEYEIDQLKLTAIISGIARPRAQVELPDGRGVNVRVGTRIGKNFGRVVRIRNDEMIIAEDYRDWSGRKVTNYIHMKLEKEVPK